jgi:hypothetical protein
MKVSVEWMTNVLLARPIHHCHNVETVNEDSTARIQLEEPLGK